MTVAALPMPKRAASGAKNGLRRDARVTRLLRILENSPQLTDREIMAALGMTSFSQFAALKKRVAEIQRDQLRAMVPRYRRLIVETAEEMIVTGKSRMFVSRVIGSGETAETVEVIDPSAVGLIDKGIKHLTKVFGISEKEPADLGADDDALGNPKLGSGNMVDELEEKIRKASRIMDADIIDDDE